MAYERTFWKNHVVDQHGEVIQVGTLIDQEHLNNMETGISDIGLALAILQFQQNQSSIADEEEMHTVDLEMNNLLWPFNNKETTVALHGLRERTDYSVECDVLEYSGGQLGCIRVKDRACNGFKLVHDGSATSVRVAVRVRGGMIAQSGPIEPGSMVTPFAST